MSDLLLCISSVFTNSWKFFTQNYIPTTEISYAALAIVLLLVPVSLSFLSLILGFPVGNVSDAESLRASASRKVRISKSRELDVR